MHVCYFVLGEVSWQPVTFVDSLGERGHFSSKSRALYWQRYVIKMSKRSLSLLEHK